MLGSFQVLASYPQEFTTRQSAISYVMFRPDINFKEQEMCPALKMHHGVQILLVLGVEVLN